jgi:hypothetical protein
MSGKYIKYEYEYLYPFYEEHLLLHVSSHYEILYLVNMEANCENEMHIYFNKYESYFSCQERTNICESFLTRIE